MLLALTELQRLAYQLAADRCPRDTLHFYLQALVFAVQFSEVFANLDKGKYRSMYGAPYHCITVHMAEIYRMVSLRSIVTETSERIFHELR